MVGTPARIVAPSCSARSTTDFASPMNRSGSRTLDPAIPHAYGRPQLLAWNIGTIGSTVSFSVMARLSAWRTPIVCRDCERWEETTPFGLPVVPDVYHMAAAVRSESFGQA